MQTMNKIETIEEFYKRKFDWMPDNIRKEIGHFKVFALEPLVRDDPWPVTMPE
jgi:AraC family transcriptional regulator, transcriptional activator of pobA